MRPRRREVMDGVFDADGQIPFSGDSRLDMLCLTYLDLTGPGESHQLSGRIMCVSHDLGGQASRSLFHLERGARGWVQRRVWAE